MKYFFGGGCCNSLEENESQILKGWQMVDAGNVSTQCYKYIQEHSLECPCINL